MSVTSPEAPAGHRRATIHPLRVRVVERLTDDAVAVEFEIPPELADEYRFLHGQHVSLRSLEAGDDIRRSYSICSSPASGRMRVAVKRLSGGVFSAYAHDRLKAGDIIEVVTPIGRFNTPLDPAQTKSYAMIAAGSGITPILSILTAILEVESQSTVTLIYGNRTVQDIMFLEELEDLKNLYPGRFAMYHVLSREEQDVPLLHGRIDREHLEQFFDQLLPPDKVDEWFLCGPREMIDIARVLLIERGTEASHVHSELFHADDLPRPAQVRETSEATAEGMSQVTIVLDGRNPRSRSLATGNASLTQRSMSAQTRRTRARVASAARAGRSYSKAAWRWSNALRSSRTSSMRASCSPVSRTRPQIKWSSTSTSNRRQPTGIGSSVTASAGTASVTGVRRMLSSSPG